MTAAARPQRLSEGFHCNIGSMAAKLRLVQASLGPVQEDRPPQEASWGIRCLAACCTTSGPAAVGQLHTKLHDYKQFLIKYGVRTSGVSESILTQHRQETSSLDLPSRDLGSRTMRTLFWLRRVKQLWRANSFCPQKVSPVRQK